MAWTLRLPDDLEARLESLSLSQGRPKSRVVQEAVEEFLENRDEEQKTWETIRSLPVLPGNPGLLEAENPVLDAVSPAGRENVGKATFLRTIPCPHRVQPGDFCHFCDRRVT